MTATTGNPHTRTPADQERREPCPAPRRPGPADPAAAAAVAPRTARCAAARLDREVTAGTSPETSTTLAARAIQLTSMRFRPRPSHQHAADTRGHRGTVSRHPLTDGYRSSAAPATPSGP
jgi:hypothetical protein